MPDRTPIIVATIGLIGTLTVGVLANSDKLASLFSARASREAVANSASPPAPGNNPEPGENSSLATPDSSAHAADTSDAPDSEPDTEATATPPPSSAPVRIAGLWISDDGYSFNISQVDAAFSYTAKQSGIDQGGGAGTIAGNRLAYSFTSPTGDGACTATISDSGNSILGSCHMNDQAWRTWPFEIKRLIALFPGRVVLPHS